MQVFVTDIIVIAKKTAKVDMVNMGSEEGSGDNLTLEIVLPNPTTCPDIDCLH